ncbi:hypothetical protein EGR_06004 [Echinococcus granulosus]|uniref:Uncharacterized protein n=1 Tax=Echinococcus granulosus TaxID=6210 RepID=W6UE51_ECHGR|nr:hypothetical protein EGR_06004 [Echinococcus granulosus]EUB59141.1 hypothetical protein EGR_06004 [Echinococcus granulosus]
MFVVWLSSQIWRHKGPELEDLCRKWESAQDMLEMMKPLCAYHEAMPARLRRVITYNGGIILDTMLSVMMFYTKDKMKNRKVFEAEPYLRAVLPPEAGGQGTPLEDLTHSLTINDPPHFTLCLSA